MSSSQRQDLAAHALDLARRLIRQASITPDTSACHQIIATALEQLGFKTEHLRFNGINNLWAHLPGETDELFVFCGHTDVVPPGDEAAWQHPPFSATIANGHLYGRGSADMKSSIAAMLAALFPLKQGEKPQRSIGMLITADEEGPALYGVKKTLATLHNRDIKIDYCLIGEPTSEKTCGDTIKNGRRGSLSLTASYTGIQGHTAYTDTADNVLHQLLAMAQRLLVEDWDALAARRNEEQRTAFNIISIQGLSAAENMTAHKGEMRCNWRYSSRLSPNKIQQRATQLLAGAELNWHPGALPYFSPLGKLSAAMQQAIKDELGIVTQCSTGGGTSDGRFFAAYGTEILEFGPRHKTIHRINECLEITEFEALVAAYARFCQVFLFKLNERT